MQVVSEISSLSSLRGMEIQNLIKIPIFYLYLKWFSNFFLNKILNNNTYNPGKKGIKLDHVGFYLIRFYLIKYNFESDQINPIWFYWLQ